MQQLRAVFGWGHPERLRAISAPVVVLHGAHDRIVEPAAGRLLAQLIPDARYVLLPDAGHLLAHEAPRELTRQLLSLPI